jgi:hypothetical protein
MPNESHKQKEATLRSGLDPRQGPGTDTVPDLGLPARLGVSTDTMPEQAGVYVPPRPLASASDHRTIEIAPVRLARDIDPRRAPTALRLSAPPPGKKGRPLLAMLGGLLLLAVGGFFAARFVFTSAAPSAALPPSTLAPSPPVPPPPPSAAKTAGSVSVGAPLLTERQAEPELVPVTPAELGMRPRRPSSPLPAPRESSDPPKKKVREPWLE